MQLTDDAILEVYRTLKIPFDGFCGYESPEKFGWKFQETNACNSTYSSGSRPIETGGKQCA